MRVRHVMKDGCRRLDWNDMNYHLNKLCLIYHIICVIDYTLK